MNNIFNIKINKYINILIYREGFTKYIYIYREREREGAVRYSLCIFLL